MYNRLSNFHDRFVDGLLCIRNSHVAIQDSISPEYLLPAWSELDRQCGREGEGVIAGQFPTLSPVIDRHSGQWRTWNVTKQMEVRGLHGGARPRKRNGRLARTMGRGIAMPPIGHGQSVDVAGGRGAWNGGQWPGLLCHGAPVETQTWRATGERDRQPAPRCRLRETQACRWMWPDDQPGSQCSSCSLPIEADWSGRICTARPMQWHN